ncbi:MAG: DUF3179 domain-containing protein [Balneolaceae bacterium]|nr:DUF3179 domain-containing protein [Balneolaceae bacterium]
MFQLIQIRFYPLLLTVLTVTGCSGSVKSGEGNTGNGNDLEFSDEWIIPDNEILDGGPGRDGIPSIDDPKFAEPARLNYPDERLVIGIRSGTEIKAYPHYVMDYHEIVNDVIGDFYYALTYCPLTGTAIAWERKRDTEFGVSGLIFRNNLIPYDRTTASRYSQMQVRGVNGPRSGSILEQVPVVQMTWSSWERIYPDSRVLTTETGEDREYDEDLYGAGYREENSGTLFPVTHSDDRLPRKELVHGVIWGRPAVEDAAVRVFVLEDFDRDLSLIPHEFAGGAITVAGSREHRFAVSYFNRLSDGRILEFEAVTGSLPIIMRDQLGNRWDIFGYAAEGPDRGTRLRPTFSYTGYWFAWVDFFPNLELFRPGDE